MTEERPIQTRRCVACHGVCINTPARIRAGLEWRCLDCGRYLSDLAWREMAHVLEHPEMTESMARFYGPAPKETER